MNRKIIHIDMDAFYASIEQRDNPEKFGEKIMKLENACLNNPHDQTCEEMKKYLAVLSLASPG